MKKRQRLKRDLRIHRWNCTKCRNRKVCDAERGILKELARIGEKAPSRDGGYSDYE